MFVSAGDRGGAASSDSFKGLLSEAGGALAVRAVVAIVQEQVGAIKTMMNALFCGRWREQEGKANTS
jgi:hypothetical protein